MKRKLENNMGKIGLFLVFAITSCVTPYYRTHNQNEAAEVAKSFAYAAFVVRDKEKAFSFLITNNKAKELDLNKLGEMIEKMHPQNIYPKIVFPLEYEIVPNTGAIRIFLKGEGENQEEFYYQIVVVKESEGHRVAGLARNMDNSPYPKTPLQKTF